MSVRRTALFWLCALFLLIVLVEAGLHVVAWIAGPPEDPRRHFSSYEEKDWADEFHRNFDAFDASAYGLYEPFLVWRVKDFRSTYVNVENGLRKTWNPDFPPGAEPREVWVFGGSTVFGAGARDEHTLPSAISRALNASSSLYRVTNYGEPGFIITQNLVHLAFLLRDGKRPDHVVFWNGGNDAIASYEAVQAGAIVSQDLVRRQLEGSPFGKMGTSLKMLASSYCLTCRAIALAYRKWDLAAFRTYEIKGIHSSTEEIQKLSQETIMWYSNSLGLLDSLSRAYGFSYHAFWQPSLFLEDRVVGDEAKLSDIVWRLDDRNLAEFYELLQKELPLVNNPNFYDYTNVLKDRTTQLYLDDIHLSEEGNMVVAQRVADVIGGGID